MERLQISEKELRNYRNEQTKKFVKLLNKAKKKPKPETIHKIRTTIRRLNILLKKGELKELMKALGRGRDLHVAQELAASYNLSVKGIKHKKKIQNDKTLKKIKAFDFMKFNKKDDSEILLHYKRAMGKLRLKLESLSPDSLSEKEMHQFRILLKKIRYGLEAIGQSSFELEEMQDYLGKIHDIDVLQSLKRKKQILTITKKMMIEDIQNKYQSIYNFMHKKLKAI